MGHIFISYSRRDERQADLLARKLQGAGYLIWLDREGIQGGEQWRARIVDAIESAAAVILLLSPNSVHSDQVRKEIDLAEGAAKPILPLEIGPVTIPANLKYQLAGLQRIQLDLSSDASFKKVITALENLGLVAEVQAEPDLLPESRQTAPTKTGKERVEKVPAQQGSAIGKTAGIVFMIAGALYFAYLFVAMINTIFIEGSGFEGFQDFLAIALNLILAGGAFALGRYLFRHNR